MTNDLQQIYAPAKGFTQRLKFFFQTTALIVLVFSGTQSFAQNTRWVQILDLKNITGPGGAGAIANYTFATGAKIRITTKGAKGGDGYTGSGGSGAVIIGEFPVSAGQVVYLDAGAAGESSIGGDFYGGGGGGGGSGVDTKGYSLIIAGAGGGGDFNSAGGGGAADATGFSNIIHCCGGGGSANGGCTGGTSGYGGNGYGAAGGGTAAYGGGGGGYYGGNFRSGGASFNSGTNQINTAGANAGPGEVIIEQYYTLNASATATQPTCSNSTQGSVAITLTGDYGGNTTDFEYAILSGTTFSGTPTFSDLNANPVSVTSGSGTAATTAGSNYTVRIRQKSNTAFYYDVPYYTLTAITAPTALCISTKTILLDATGKATISGADINNGSTTVCGIQSLSLNKTAFDCMNTAAPVTVTLTVTVTGGNTNSCTSAITVQDNIKPTITAPADITVYAQEDYCSTTAYINLGTPVTSDNCAVKSVSNNLPSSLPLGVKTIIWTVTDASGNTQTATQKITVIESDKPVILNCPQDITVIVPTKGVCVSVSWTAPTLANYCTKIISFTSGNKPGDLFCKDDNKVSYKAADASGHDSKCEFHIKFKTADKTSNDDLQSARIFTSTATAEANRVRIDFTGNGINVTDYFSVLKLSAVNGQWSVLETKRPASGNTQLSAYTVYDNSPAEGGNYYRTDEVLNDGNTITGQVQKVYFTSLKGLTVFPNPTSDYLDVNLKNYQGKDVTIYLYNQLGVVQAVKQVQNVNGQLPERIDLNNLSDGTYLFRVESKGVKDAVQPVVIQKQ